MSRDLPTSSRAMRRAVAAKARKGGGLSEAERHALAIIEQAREKGRTVDGDLVTMPALPGQALAFSVEFEEASLEWNATWKQIDDYVAVASQALQGIREPDRRPFAREQIVQTLANNKHLRGGKESQAVCCFTCWLMFTGPSAAQLRRVAINHVAYVISRTGPGEYNFRLIGG